MPARPSPVRADARPESRTRRRTTRSRWCRPFHRRRFWIARLRRSGTTARGRPPTLGMPDRVPGTTGPGRAGKAGYTLTEPAIFLGVCRAGRLSAGGVHARPTPPRPRRRREADTRIASLAPVAGAIGGNRRASPPCGPARRSNEAQNRPPEGIQRIWPEPGQPIRIRVPGPTRRRRRTRSARRRATQPSVGRKPPRATCRKIAEPRPGRIGPRLWSRSTTRS